MRETARATGALLWFDVERRYKTMPDTSIVFIAWLWFDVERRYKTIYQS